ncbi:MAG TPA: sigma factor-like helix-turn-helix DNA-binding protein [Acidimicrobiales bacterium]
MDEPALFGEVFDRHVDAVLAFFYRRTGCAQVSADLMAETFHDLSYAEVASRLGCSEGAARVRVSRGLSRIAVAMEGEVHD